MIIAGLAGLGIYAPLAVPYDEAVRLWRGGEGVWIENPRNALPAWVNLLPGKNLPTTLVRTARDGGAKTIESGGAASRAVDISIPFTYDSDDFPSGVSLFFEARFQQQQPLAAMFWRQPDGRQISLGDRSIGGAERYSISSDQQLVRRLGGLPAEVALFADRRGEKVQKGRYELTVEGLVFDEGSDLDARLVVYGQVHGLAGTDHKRRDLTIALLWGTPIALAFGLLAAVGSSVTTLGIAAIGVWYGGWVDAAIQRITEVNAILPSLPILILVATLYSRSIWVILGIVILLNIFSLGIKFYRALFLQVKATPYIEAARAYGAGNLRIVFRYMVPRVLPVLVPGLVTAIPSFVFLETSLAFLGLGDPSLPTWGKMLNDAYQDGALYKGYYYWMLQPSALLMLTGLSFAMMGFALDRLFNPRLRIQ
jgi:peptide/nickel transport system permease protein